MSKYAPHRRGTNNPVATSSTVCQKCLKTGHFIYECKSTRPYVSRPSRTKLLEDPKLREKDRARREAGPSVDLPEEFKKKSGVADRILSEKEKARAIESGEKTGKDKGKDKEREKKRARRSSRSDSDSGSGSSSDSDSDSDSGSSSGSSSGSESSRSRSRSRDRRRKVPSRGGSRSASR